MERSYKRKWVVKGIVGGLIFLALATLGAMYLWNYLMVSIFALPEITYWEALGLMVLGRILTGGFGHRGGRHRTKHWGGHWKERWQQMPEEARTIFMATWKKRWEDMSDQERKALMDYCSGRWDKGKVEDKKGETDEKN